MPSSCYIGYIIPVASLLSKAFDESKLDTFLQIGNEPNDF